MDVREREIIRRNHRLLTQNIILTEEFFDHLKNYHVLPETMIKDIKKESTRENRNSKLLELLVLRGCDSFRKLRHILHLTGHCILADYLYGEDADIKVFKPEEIFGKYSTIFSKVPDDVKMKFIKTLESKVKERSILNVWERNPDERSELLETHSTSFESEKLLRFKLDSKRKQVRQMGEEVRKLNEELRKRNIEIELMKREENERKKAYKSEISVQAKFNAANSNSLIKLKDRFSSFNGRIRAINGLLEGFIGESSNVSCEEADNVKLAVLEHNVKLVIEKARESRGVAHDALDEQQTIYRFLNTFPKRNEPLSETIRKYIAKEDKGKKNLFKELERLRATLKGPSKFGSLSPVTDLNLLSNMAATIRVEIEHLQKKMIWKESQITSLRDENTSLKQNPSPPPLSPALRTRSSKSESSPSSPESTYEMQQAYDNVDDYLEDEATEFKPRLAVARETTNGSTNQRPGTTSNGSGVFTPDVADDKRVPTSAADEILPNGTNGVNNNYTKDKDFEELQSSRGVTPNSVAIRLDVGTSKPPSNALTLPDIMERDTTRHPLLKSSTDFTKILENSDDNDQLEKITSLLAKRTQFGKLPSIFQTVNYLTD